MDSAQLVQLIKDLLDLTGELRRAEFATPGRWCRVERVPGSPWAARGAGFWGAFAAALARGGEVIRG